MPRILTAVLAALLWLASPARPDDLFSRIQEITGELTRITGLKPLKKIEHAAITKEQVNRFLRDRLKEELSPEEIRIEELALKKVGFVPQDFDLAKNTVDLFTEQAAAFYDFRKKKLYVLDSAPAALQSTALVHELAHALADQHFHLEKFIRHGGASDDSSLARMAVMEGQAAWLMSEYAARQMGQSLKGSPTVADMVRRKAEVSAGQFPVFDAAPLYMRETLLFPYMQGMLFQHMVIEKLGQEGFREIFRHPPSTAQQILHPEKYFAHVEPHLPLAPELASEKSYKRLTDGTLGEFDHAILLRQYVGEKEAAALAPQWRGAVYKLIERKDRGATILAYASEWETPEAARRFFALYRKVLQGKWKSMEVTTEKADLLAGRGEDGYFVVRLAGARVTSLEGLRSPEEAAPVR